MGEVQAGRMCVRGANGVGKQRAEAGGSAEDRVMRGSCRFKSCRSAFGSSTHRTQVGEWGRCGVVLDIRFNTWLLNTLLEAVGSLGNASGGETHSRRVSWRGDANAVV